MVKQLGKSQAFAALHARAGTFVMPNPWDAGSARILQDLGFVALATTSSGFARSRGQRDGDPGRQAVLEHAAQLAAATDVPLSADLEDGFGPEPEDVARTITDAVAVGLAGGSIEDYTGRKDQPLYPIPVAAERVRAASEAARSAAVPFVLTARAENFFRGVPDLADTIRRLQAYQEAGADVLFAPALRSAEDLRSVLAEIDRPLSVLAGLGGLSALTLADYQALGVRRLSVGGALASLAYGALFEGARELAQHGSFAFTKRAGALGRELAALAKPGSS